MGEDSIDHKVASFPIHESQLYTVPIVKHLCILLKTNSICSIIAIAQVKCFPPYLDILGDIG